MKTQKWFGFEAGVCHGNVLGDCCTWCGVQLKNVRPCRWGPYYQHLCVRCYEVVAALEALRQ